MHAYSEHYTADDYNQWEGDWELIEGMPYAMTPSPGVSHQRLAGKLYRLLDEKLDHCPTCMALTGTDWHIADDTIVRPDVLMICHEPGQRIVRTPEVVIEVVSPGSTRRDETVKFDLYEREGVAFYLLVYPDRQVVKLYRNHEGRFVKVGDYHDEQTDLLLEKCKLRLDFSRVW